MGVRGYATKECRGGGNGERQRQQQQGDECEKGRKQQQQEVEKKELGPMWLLITSFGSFHQGLGHLQKKQHKWKYRTTRAYSLHASLSLICQSRLA